MKRMIIRARIRNRAEEWIEEYSVVVRDDMTPMEYAISVVNNFNQRHRPNELARECVQVREISKLTMDMEHDWTRGNGVVKRKGQDRFICKRCGWVGIREPNKAQINCLPSYSKTPHICNWHI